VGHLSILQPFDKHPHALNALHRLEMASTSLPPQRVAVDREAEDHLLLLSIGHLLFGDDLAATQQALFFEEEVSSTADAVSVQQHLVVHLV
jgi:hypothetical protein